MFNKNNGFSKQNGFAKASGLNKLDGFGLSTADFSPADISNLVSWFSARTSSSLLTSGGDTAEDTETVETWNPISGSGQWTEATNPPVKNDDFQNGLPVVDFDGSNDLLNPDSEILGCTNNIDGFSLVLIGKPNNGTGTDRLFMLSNGISTGSARCLIQIDGTGKMGIAGRRLDTDGYQSLLTPSNGYTAFGMYVFTWDWGNAQASIWKDGSYILNPTSFQTAGNTSATNSLDGWLGKDNGSAYTNLEIGDLLKYQKALSTAEMDQLKTYFDNIWGL